MKKLLALLFLLLIPLASAQVAIKSFTSNPDKISPGQEVQITLTLENVGDKDIKNILVKLDLNQLPFAPLRSSTEQVIDQIDKDDLSTIYFNLIALPNADSQIYKMPVKISYENISKDALISLEVSAKAKLDVLLEDSKIVKVNDNGKITLKLVNNGLTKIKFLKVNLEKSPAYETISPNSVYVGEVDVDDFQTVDFTIIPKIKDPQLNLQVFYRDQNNNEFQETKFLKLNVYTEEEAKQLGLVKQNPLTTILIIIIALIILIIIYRKIRKKNVN